MRILVCGGRNFGDTNVLPEFREERIKEYKFIHRTLDELARKYSKEYKENDNWLPTDITIISGAARGADRAASDWATCNYARLEEFPADWVQYGKRAGPIRNEDMLNRGNPNLVISFPGGRGTAHMVKIAKKAGVEVVEITYAES